MSRSHAYEYCVELPDADPFTIHDEICGTVVPQSICQGGGSAGQVIDFWLWTNKTKAKRLAARLDAHFGTVGTLRLLDDVYSEAGQ